MYYVLTRRTVRVAVGHPDRFGARYNNHFSWDVSGPFGKRPLAERAAAAAMATHTCLAAQVLTEEQLVALAEARYAEQSNHELTMAAKHAVKWIQPA